MSFESGSVATRLFYAVDGLPKDAVERFSRHEAPPLKSLGSQSTQGWVGGRHLLDVPITEENAHYGGYLRLALVKAERKVPTSLLRAECLLEEVAYMQEEGKPFVDRKARSDIRKEVMNRLLPTMPPTLKGIPFIYDDRDHILYAAALSDNQLDAFLIHFKATVGVDLIPIATGTAAAKRRNINVADWSKTSFSPEVPDAEMEDTPGLDFLTWLWFASEARGGIFNTKQTGEFGIAIECPLLFTRAGDEANEISLRKGLPTVSAEAKTALLSGKKLRRAKLLLSRTDETWSCSFDAETFVFRGLKLPEPKEMLDPASRFQERVQKIADFRDLFFELFDLFLDDRCDTKKWSATKKEIHQWSADRAMRR